MKAWVSLALGVLLGLGLAPTARAAVAPSSIGPNVMVNARTGGQLVEDFKSPAVAINPNNANQVVIASRIDRPDFNCQIQFSTDGGASWSPASFPPPPRGTCWSPSVAWDASGNVYVAAQNRPPGGGAQDIIVWRSTNGGQSFSAPVVIPGSSGFQAGIAVDTHGGSPFKGRVYVTWYNLPNFPASIDTRMSFSDDGGGTWSPPTSRPVAGQFQQFPQPAVAPDGTVYVVFKDTFAVFAGFEPVSGCRGGIGSGDPSRGATCPIRVLRSSNGGVSFDADPFTVATAHYNDLSVAEQPGIAVTPSGTVLVSYSSIRTPPAPGCASDQDVFAARSTNRGASWSPLRLNDDPCTSGATQRNPWVSVAPNGRVDAVFYDNREDSTEPKNLYGVRYANSTDEGQTFGPNVRINNVNFDNAAFFAPKTPGFQSNEFDQVNGIDSTNDRAVAAWGDPRNAPSQSSTRSDVFSVGIGFPQAPGPGSYPQPYPGPAPGPRSSVCPAASSASVIRGTAAGNRITGTVGADRILSAGGNDVVDALPGNDCVDLGTGADRGQGGSGRDSIAGGRGRDRVSGSSGNDRLRGGQGNDRLTPGRGNDRAFGDAGNDLILGSFGNDVLHGVGGNDRLSGSRGRDRINGGAGWDRIAGGSSPDRIRGDRGNDRLNGNSASDRISGNSGNDRISARDGKRDRIDCGPGRDRVIADSVDRVARNCERVRRRGQRASRRRR